MSTRKLKDWIEAYVYYCHDSEPPIKYHEWNAVSIIAAALQRKCRLVWGSRTIFPNFFIALVGPAGKGRKGTAMDFARDFIDEVGIALASDAGSVQALIRRISESTDTVEITCDDGRCAIEAHSSLTAFAPELAVFIPNGRSSESKKDLTYLCDLYDCRSRFRYETIGRGLEEITGVYLNIIGGITPEIIRTTMSPDIVGTGFPSRFIYVYEPGLLKRVPSPFFTMSTEGKTLRSNLLDDLQSIKTLRGKFRVTQNFINFWNEWYGAYPEDCPFEPHLFGAYWERRPSHLIKLSLIFSASRSNNMLVDVSDMKRAIKFIEETEIKMPRAFAGVGRSQNASLIKDLMEFFEARGEVTHSEVVNNFKYDASNWELEKLLHTLRQMKFISMIEQSHNTIYKLITKR